MTIKIIGQVGFPYGGFTVFSAKKKGRKIFIVRKDSIIVFRTKDSTKRSRKKAFDKAIELDKKSKGVKI